MSKEKTMKKIFRYWYGLLCFFVLTGNCFAISTAPGVNTHNNNFLGGILHGQITKDYTDYPYHTALSGGIDAGYRDFRASGTVGWEATANQRVKVTGEYLTQNIDYNFYSGVTRRWVQQAAAGLEYQYAFNDRCQNFLSLSGWYSHAPSISLGTRNGTFINSSGQLVAWTDVRRIAGSDAGGVSPGITTHLWLGNEASLALNWDDVVYDNALQPQKKAQGFGGTAKMSQLFHIGVQDFKIGASVAARTPFNYYEANLDWIKPFANSNLVLGLFGNYTQGKFSLPNTSLVGVNVAYAIDTPAPRAQAQTTQTFLEWTSIPAVKMPQVLAIADEQVRKVPGCIPPTFNGTIADQIAVAGSILTFNSPSQFSGANLTYSETHVNTAGATPTISINPTTGVLTATAGSGSVNSVTITATNACGSVSSNTFIAELD